jgi:hypothetical protein
MPFVPLTEYLEIRWNILIKQEMKPMALGFNLATESLNETAVLYMSIISVRFLRPSWYDYVLRTTTFALVGPCVRGR